MGLPTAIFFSRAAAQPRIGELNQVFGSLAQQGQSSCKCAPGQRRRPCGEDGGQLPSERSGGGGLSVSSAS